MIEQRSDEWFAIRRGKFTASQIYRLMGIKGLGKTGETYVMECVTEELGGRIPSFETKAMEHGTLTEPFARNFYEAYFLVEVEEQPFFIAEWCDQAGCSPDGIVKYNGEEWGIEIKCPMNPVNHLEYLLLKDKYDLKKEYPNHYWQVQMAMAVTNIPYWDFISYHEGFEDNLRMAYLRVSRNEEDIELLKSRIAEAVKMKNEIIERIKQL